MISSPAFNCSGIFFFFFFPECEIRSLGPLCGRFKFYPSQPTGYKKYPCLFVVPRVRSPYGGKLLNKSVLNELNCSGCFVIVFQFCCSRVTWFFFSFFLQFWRWLWFSRRVILGKGWRLSLSLRLCVCVCVCAGGGSLPREHNKLFVFIMHLAFEEDMKGSLFYFIFNCL